MASITPILDTAYKRKDGNYNLFVRINHGHKRKKVSVGYKIKESQFKGGRVVNHPHAAVINAKIASVISEAEQYIADASMKNKPVRIELIGSGHTSHSFCSYLSRRSDQYRANGQIIMYRKLKRLAEELQLCFGRDVHFDDLTADALRVYEAWLIKQENSSNTRAKKYKMLSEYFDQAAREDMTTGRNPFKSHHIAKVPILKDKLTKGDISAIEGLPLSDGPVNDARNLFLFSYYAKGARFETCVTLLREQIRDGRIYIQANKGKKHISVKIHQRLDAILKKYPDGDIVFPFLKKIETDPEKYLQATAVANVMINRSLKVIAALCNIKINLTFHVARHSFAQHLKEVSGNIHVIKDSLGHSDTKITEMYLKSLGDEILDNEMDKVYGE